MTEKPPGDCRSDPKRSDSYEQMRKLMFRGPPCHRTVVCPTAWCRLVMTLAFGLLRSINHSTSQAPFCDRADGDGSPASLLCLVVVRAAIYTTAVSRTSVAAACHSNERQTTSSHSAIATTGRTGGAFVSPPPLRPAFARLPASSGSPSTCSNTLSRLFTCWPGRQHAAVALPCVAARTLMGLQATRRQRFHFWAALDDRPRASSTLCTAVLW